MTNLQNKSKDAAQNTRKTKKKNTRNEVAAEDLAILIDALPSKETPSEYGRQSSGRAIRPPKNDAFYGPEYV